MSKSIMQATQVMIAFQVEGDRESDLVSLLQTITQIALLIWGFWQWVSRIRWQLKGFCLDCQITAAGVTFSEILSRAARPLTIGFSSVVFGVG
jgi:hypothetical protein